MWLNGNRWRYKMIYTDAHVRVSGEPQTDSASLQRSVEDRLNTSRWKRRCKALKITQNDQEDVMGHVAVSKPFSRLPISVSPICLQKL